MPPIAMFSRQPSEPCLQEDDFFFGDMGGIEVEALELSHASTAPHRIVFMPRELEEEDEPMIRKKRYNNTSSPTSATAGLYKNYLQPSGPAALTRSDSVDSLDEIKAGSNEARLIQRIAEANQDDDGSVNDGGSVILGFNPDSGDIREDDSYYMEGGAESKYLDVLDRHLEETDPHATSYDDLLESPRATHPRKSQGQMDVIIEHFLDGACCQCDMLPKPKSALLQPRWTPDGRPLRQEEDVNRSRSVQFNEVNITEFPMTLGNHPNASSGPPVMLDVKPRSTQSMDLESYEKGRQPRRSRRQLKLSLQQRHAILVKEKGFTFDEVKSAWQEALDVRKQRKETLERGLTQMKLDEVWESTCRKFNRIVNYVP